MPEAVGMLRVVYLICATFLNRDTSFGGCDPQGCTIRRAAGTTSRLTDLPSHHDAGTASEAVWGIRVPQTSDFIAS